MLRLLYGVNKNAWWKVIIWLDLHEQHEYKHIGGFLSGSLLAFLLGLRYSYQIK